MSVCLHCVLCVACVRDAAYNGVINNSLATNVARGVQLIGSLNTDITALLMYGPLGLVCVTQKHQHSDPVYILTR